MKCSFVLVCEWVENLKVKVFIDGQVGNFDVQIGQFIVVGEYIGQIIIFDLKVQVQIDEYYVEWVVFGFLVDFICDGGNYKFEVIKFYLEVKEG